MAKVLRPITKSAYLITIAGIKGTWSKCAGGEEEFETGDYVDPNDRKKKTVRGVSKVGNLKLAKPYHPEEDAPIVDWWQNYRDNGEPGDVSVTVQSIKQDKQRTQFGKPRTYYGCQVIKFKDPEADLDSSDAAMLEVELSVDHLERA
ncbi:hypothetical protein IQ268_08885 [Oculatella sp. LEGE 06141]|uniref:hypothetical protein n=1 Tax=Oculatella sp. LEGE 06141 TaxID=1828648 RepID=UPI001881578B|nr:hypothetical protein [Oculatella sp. LEGE 06141]MBE9178673.1 hypothetical protein [Oculatella sp. LEGE 06141]